MVRIKRGLREPRYLFIAVETVVSLVYMTKKTNAKKGDGLAISFKQPGNFFPS